MAKILVVDDNRDHAESLAAILAGAGYEVIKETRAKEVFKVAKAQKPDMVMLDVNMPELNGLEAARILKSNKETKDLLVLIHSATDKALCFNRRWRPARRILLKCRLIRRRLCPA